MSYESLFNRKVSVYKISSTVSEGKPVFSGTALATGLLCSIRPLSARDFYISQDMMMEIRASHIMYAHDNSNFVAGNAVKVTYKKDRSGSWSTVSDGSEFIILTKIENADNRDDMVIMQIGPLTQRVVGS